MPRTCFILIAGLDANLLQKSGHLNLPLLHSFKHRSPYTPVLPAVTSTIQATLTTGTLPTDHGIICNGLYTHNQPQLHQNLDLTNHAEARKNVSFWEQSNALLQRPRFWKDSNKKIAMLFCQNSIGAADIILTPKPTHTPDGKTLTACFSNPPELYAALTQNLGPFPLHNYWSPMANLNSSTWIANAAQHVWTNHTPDLQLLYIPHLDYNLLRLGPNHPQIQKDLADLDSLLTPLANQIRADGGTLLLAGDYGMSEVHTPLTPNLTLRTANLLTTTSDPNGKLLIDYESSKAFALCDHQIAYLYIKPTYEKQTLAALTPLLTQSSVLSPQSSNPRAGQLTLLAKENAWFAHDYWLNDSEKPAWQFSVDIHNKPGFDPRELFFDPQKKCISQNLSLPKGSHGLIDNPSTHPMLLADIPLPQNPHATHIAPWLRSLL